MEENIFKLAEKVVVRIECENIQQDINIPFDQKTFGNSFGSGFFISSEYILTNHHVIQKARKIYINIPDIGKQTFLATIISYSISNDYAILKIHDYVNKNELFKLGDSNKLKEAEKLYVIGFPLGNINPNLKIVSGMMTGWERNKIQHDTNTNPGMSGGVILNSSNEIVGIHIGVITGKNWTNTAYAIPINVVNIPKRLNVIKKSSKYPIVIKEPVFGFKTQVSHLELIKSITSNSKYIKPQIGVVISSVYSNFKTLMESGDILFKICDHTVDNFKDIKYNKNPNNNIIYDYLTHYYDIDDEYTIYFYSNKRKKIIKEKHRFKDELTYVPNKIRTIDLLTEKLDYENIGGIIVVELTTQHIKHFISSERVDLIYKFIKYKEKSVLEDKDKLLIVTYVTPTTPLYKNNIIVSGSIIKKINNKPVKTLDEYRKALLNGKDTITVHLDNNKIEVINFKFIKKYEQELSKQYNFPISNLYSKLKIK